MKIYILIIFTTALFILTINHYQNKIQNIEHKLSTHKQNEQILNHKIKEIYNEKNILEEKNKKLSNEAKKDSFDWNKDISNTYVIKQLQKN